MGRIVLVTGGGGLVGHALRRVEHKSEIEFVYLSSRDGDLREADQVDQLFAKYRPEYVVHLAARVGGLFANMADNLGFFMDNMKMNMHVVECCAKYKVKHAVFCLSTCVFPAETTLPMDESVLHAGAPHASNEGYAHAKRMLECMVRYFKSGGKYPQWTCVIPTNIFGENDNFHATQSHVIPALIRKCVEAKRNDTAFVVAGSGTPLRQFIYARDLVEIIVQLLFREEPLDTSYIACDMDTELSIREVAETIKTAVGFEGPITLDTSKADGIFRKTATNAKLKATLPDTFKFTPFVEAMTRTVQWYIENELVARKE